MTNTSVIVSILETLGITYRRLPCKRGEFYYCIIPGTRKSFDLRCDIDGTIRLWKFINIVPQTEAGKRYEHFQPANPHTVIGVEVTDEGDVSFYAEQLFNAVDSEEIAYCIHMIKAYISIICEID